MEFFQTFVAIAAVMLLAEFADKTSLIALSLSSSTSRPFTVASGGLVGITLMTVAGVTMSVFLGQSLPLGVLQWIAVLLFLGIGISGFLGDGDDEVDEVPPPPKHLFLRSVSLVGLAEVGDKSQLFVVAQALVANPLAVLLGAVVGMGVVLFVSAYAGEGIIKVVPADKLNKIASLIFIVFGLALAYSLIFP